MSTQARPNRSGTISDMVILVLFVVFTIAGFVSITFNSSNGLAYTQLVLTVGGLLLGIAQVKPRIIGNWSETLLQNTANVFRVLTIGLLVVIIVLQVLLLSGHASTPPQPPSHLAPTNFAVTTLTLKNGQVLQDGQAIPLAEVPLTITGTYSSQGSGQVWVLVGDIYGNYYLQHPPVRFGDAGQWTAYNVVTALGTTSISFVSVTARGNETFEQMVATNNSGGFTILPDGSKVLQILKIRVVDSAKSS